MSPGVPAVLCFAVLLGALSGCTDEEPIPPGPEWRLDSVASVVDASRLGDTSLVLAFERVIGEGMLIDVGVMAVSEDEVLAVFERADCAMAFFDLRADTLIKRFGRCGAGPEEFYLVNTMVFRGDTLLAFDRQRRSFVQLRPDGTFLGRMLPDALASGEMWTIAQLGVLPHGELISSSLEPGLRYSRIVSVLDGRSGRLLRRMFPALPAVMGDTTASDSHAWHCVGAWRGGATIVLANMWQDEIVGADAEGNILWSTYTALPWLGPVRRNGRTARKGMVPPPICAASGVLSRAVAFRPRGNGEDDHLQGRIEIRDSVGRLLVGADVPAGVDFLWSRRVAAAGDRWYFTDEYSSEPRILVFRLRKRAVGEGRGILMPPEVANGSE